MAHAQHFPIDEEDALSHFVLDVEIVSEGDEFLSHLVTMAGLTFQSFLSSSSEHKKSSRVFTFI
jgi:hypothetical protein